MALIRLKIEKEGDIMTLGGFLEKTGMLLLASKIRKTTIYTGCESKVQSRAN